MLEGTLHQTAYAEMLRPEYDKLGLPFLLEPKLDVMEETDIADVVITQSDFGRSTYISAGVPSERVVPLPLGVDKSLFYPIPRLRAKKGPLRVLYVGSLSVRKGVHHLLASMRQLSPEVATLTLVGDMHDEFVSVWKRMTLPLQGRVSLKPAVLRAELPTLYREADVMVLPSICDSFGQVVIESLACGTPVIATTTCGAQPRPGLDGLVVSPGDAQALAAAIQHLWEDRDLLDGMSALAPEGVRTWEDFQIDFLDLALQTVRGENHNGTTGGNV
jgi:glycosyltransferase involved in cell wall biosynthesis